MRVTIFFRFLVTEKLLVWALSWEVAHGALDSAILLLFLILICIEYLTRSIEALPDTLLFLSLGVFLVQIVIVINEHKNG